MKTIYLVRHAKAARNDEIPDIERPLAERGREEARHAVLKMKGVAAPDLLVSSPAVRAMETAAIFAAELGYPIEKIAHRKALYDQNANAFRTVLREMKDSCERVMLFGHNPSITDAARAFAPGFHDELPTSGSVTIVFETTSWKEIAEGRGKLLDVKCPQMAIKTDSFKHMKKELASKLAERMVSILAELDSVAAEEIRDKILLSGEKIAGKFVKLLKKKNKQSKTKSPKPEIHTEKSELR